MAFQQHFKLLHAQLRHCRSLTAICLLLLSQATFAADTRIAVLYPETNTRVAQLYATIIKGMQTDNVEIRSRALSDDDRHEDVERWLSQQDSQAVVLLGKQGKKFSTQLKVNIPIVTGAHVAVQPGRSTVALAADPKQLLQVLKQLEPEIQRVHVIYNENNSGWLMKYAQRAAKRVGVKLNAIQADTMQASGKALKKIVDNANPKNDAIWLLLDPVVPVKPLLPALLKQAWSKNLIIFSGNPYHVQQGTLFALYPDYNALGKQLIALAENKINVKGQARHEPSQYLKSAINIRTASHLDIQVSSREIEDFNLVFPAR